MNMFSYQRAANLESAIKELKKQRGQALPLAGGTDLLGLIKDGVATPAALISLRDVLPLNQIAHEKNELTIGAMTKVARVAEHPEIRNRFRVLSEAAREVASPQLRNMGTVGGNLCQRPRCWYFRGDFHCIRKGGDICFAVDGRNKYHCVVGGGPCFIVHPSDLAVALLALDARLEIHGEKKKRTVSLPEFYVSPDQDATRETILEPGELVVWIRVPSSKGQIRSGYLKFKERGAWDFAVVSVAAVLEMNGDTIRSARVAMGGVAPVPYLERTVSEALTNSRTDEASLERAASLALQQAEPLAENEYKVILARNLIKKLLRRLVA